MFDRLNAVDTNPKDFGLCNRSSSTGQSTLMTRQSFSALLTYASMLGSGLSFARMGLPPTSTFSSSMYAALKDTGSVPVGESLL